MGDTLDSLVATNEAPCNFNRNIQTILIISRDLDKIANKLDFNKIVESIL